MSSFHSDNVDELTDEILSVIGHHALFLNDPLGAEGSLSTEIDDQLLYWLPAESIETLAAILLHVLLSVVSGAATATVLDFVRQRRTNVGDLIHESQHLIGIVKRNCEPILEDVQSAAVESIRELLSVYGWPRGIAESDAKQVVKDLTKKLKSNTNNDPRVFLSYRRDDTSFETTAIHEKLALAFGADRVHMDAFAVFAGQDFRAEIGMLLQRTDTLIAVIGKSWLGLFERNYEGQEDYVRTEVVEAIRLNIPIIPLLIGDVAMPRAHELPTELSMIGFQNAARIRSGMDFANDISLLIHRLRELVRDP